MKIGDGQDVRYPGGLFERIENASQGADSDQVAATGGAGQAEHAQPASASSGVEQGDRAQQLSGKERWEHLDDPLQRSLLELCAGAIDGEFESEKQLCDRVVQAIVEQRYAHELGSTQQAQVIQTLSATLTADPTFRDDIEHLLLLAARELA